MSNPVSLFVGNTAILEITLGVELTGDTWPKPLVYVAGSEGLYRALLSHNVAMEEGANYLYAATASASGMVASWGGDVNAVRRAF